MTALTVGPHGIGGMGSWAWDSPYCTHERGGRRHDVVRGEGEADGSAGQRRHRELDCHGLGREVGGGAGGFGR